MVTTNFEITAMGNWMWGAKRGLGSRWITFIPISKYVFFFSLETNTFYSMSWNLRIARPGISEWTSLRTTSLASSHGKTECGGG